MSTVSNSSSENEPEETTSTHTRKRGGRNADNNKRNKSGDVAAGASTRKKARVALEAAGEVTSAAAAAAADLSKEREEEILQILMQDLCSDDKWTIWDGLNALSIFCTTGFVEQRLANADFIVENDGVGLVMMVMKQNLTEADILAVGSGILANLMFYVDGALNKVHRLGGAETFINAMKENPDHEPFQGEGCCFLRNFTLTSSDRRELVVDVHGIPTIVAAMKKHLNNKVLQAHAINGLSHGFCVEKEYVAVVYEAGAFSAMATALENHAFDTDTKDVINKLIEYRQSVIQAESD